MTTSLNITTNSTYNKTYNKKYNSTTGYSTLPFQQKTLSQIKRENKNSKIANIRYIENMYRNANFFNYDRNNSRMVNHKSHLS